MHQTGDQIRVQFLDLPQASCATMSKSLHFSVPQFPIYKTENTFCVCPLYLNCKLFWASHCVCILSTQQGPDFSWHLRNDVMQIITKCEQ